MKARLCVVGTGVAVVTVLAGGAPAWARSDPGTATEVCTVTSDPSTVASTATVDIKAADSLEAADLKFNAVAGQVLGLTCQTTPN